MSRQKFFLLLSFILVFLIAIGLYLYTKNIKDSPVPTMTEEEIRKEEMRKELMQYTQSEEYKKTPEEQKKELEAFRPPSKDKMLTKEEMMRELTEGVVVE